ncbi:MAG: restriction endonuclease [Gammaproteobacteria bacterium]|nr:MAG: restriction endonuclease [Gammaproteobacteria bacterium]
MSRRMTLGLGDLVRLPWYLNLLAAGAMFMLFHFVVPTLFTSAVRTPLANSTTELVSNAWTIVGLAIGGLFMLAAVVSLYRRAGFGGDGAGALNFDKIEQLSWQEFEGLCTAFFKQQGYEVSETVQGLDGGMDLQLHKDDMLTVVHCKHWPERETGVFSVRELFGIVVARNARKGLLVSSGSFSEEARSFARDVGIRLICGQELAEAAASMPESVTRRLLRFPIEEPPGCPDCGATMILRSEKRAKGTKSRFWICRTFPDCHGKRAA